MKHFALVGVLALAVFTAMPAIARADHIQVANTTHDAWVWVTVINGRNIGAWCVDPGKVRSENYGVVAKVRVEVTKGANCAHPVMLDRTLDNYIPIPGTNQVRRAGGYVVSGSHGVYTFKN